MASKEHSLAFVLYGCKLVLPFENAICSLVDVNIAFAIDCFKAISKVVAYIHSSMVHSAESIANAANWHHWDVAITVGERVWLSIEHLKIPPPFSYKLAVYFAGLLPILPAIGSVIF